MKCINDNTVYKDFEVIVLISPGQDYKFIDSIKDVYGFDIKVHRFDKVKDIWEAYDKGIDIAKSSYIVCLADDAEVCPRWLTFAVQEYKSQGCKGMIGLWDGIKGDGHSVHFLMSRAFYKKYRVKEYKHLYQDTEYCLAAKYNGVYRKSLKAVALHYHPQVNKDLMDGTYKKNFGDVDKHDKALYDRRKKKVKHLK